MSAGRLLLFFAACAGIAAAGFLVWLFSQVVEKLPFP